MPSEESASAVATLVTTLVQMLRDGPAENIDGIVADDAIVIGPGAHDVAAGAQAPPSLREWSARLKRAGMTVSDDPVAMHVAVSASGASAWAWAFPVVRTGAGETPSRLRVTVLADIVEASWRLVHVHLSCGLANAELASRPERIAAPVQTADDIARGSDPLRQLVLDNLGPGMIDLIAPGPDVVVIGTDPEEVFEGADSWLAIAEPLREQAAQLAATSRHRLLGGVQTRMTRDDQCAALTGVVALDFGGGPLPPFRLGWIFTRMAGAFRLVCDHHSLPMVDEGPAA
jgi:hypothetical protein